jgi:hypothetical protein
MAHAAANVDHNSHGDRNVFAPENFKGLFDSVLKNLEGRLRQIRNKPSRKQALIT